MPQPPRALAPLRVSVWVLTVLVGAATILGFAGSAWWGFDLIANFRVQLLGLAAVLAVVGVMADPRAAAVAVTAAVLNGVVVVPLAFADARQAAPGDRLHVLSFNVQASNPQREDVIEYLRESDADVIFLLESSRDWEGDALRLGVPYDIFTTRPRDRSFGITVLTRGGAAIVPHTVAGDTVVEVQLAFAGDTLSIFAVHPLSPTSSARAVRRDRLLEAVADLVTARAGPAVVVGDLNATPWSHAFRSLVADSGLVNSLRGYGLQPTWPANFWPLLIPIDHVLHSETLVTAARFTGPRLGSDHRPLHVVLAPAA